MPASTYRRRPGSRLCLRRGAVQGHRGQSARRLLAHPQGERAHRREGRLRRRLSPPPRGPARRTAAAATVSPRLPRAAVFGCERRGQGEMREGARVWGLSGRFCVAEIGAQPSDRLGAAHGPK
jgi:hypothetical protein